MPQRPHGENSQRVLIFGGGGIGGTLAARLAGVGRDVTVITRNPSIAEAITRRGLRSHYEGAVQVAHPDAVATLEELGEPDGRFAAAFVAVPPSSAEQAAHDALPWLEPDAPIVCCPNGLIEERLESQLPPERIIGGIVTFAGSMLGPGEVKKTSTGGGITLGRLPQAQRAEDPQLERVAALLEGAVPVRRTDNLRGARWSKLALNCAVSSLGTVGGNRLGILMHRRIVRRMMLEVVTEVVTLAQAESIDLVRLANTIDLNWLALSDGQRRRKLGSAELFSKHTLLLIVGMKYRKMRSSMLRALERGRRPPVDFLNGEVTSRAPRHGLAVPVNAALQEAIHAIADGEKESSFETLREVYARTR